MFQRLGSPAASMLKWTATGVDPVEEPPAVGLPLGPHDLDSLQHSGVRGRRPRPGSYGERGARHTANRRANRGARIAALDTLARALPAELAPPSDTPLRGGRRSLRRAREPDGCTLVFEQPVEHVIIVSNEDRDRSFFGLEFQPPSSSRSLKDPLDDRRQRPPRNMHRSALVRPLMQRFDLAVEVRLPGVLPAPVLGDERIADGLHI